jgi:GNAT superfamily N-acetyltransferase
VRNDLSEEVLAGAVELNSAEFLRAQGRLPWVEFHDEGDALWIFAGDTWPRNTVALARFSTQGAARRIREILKPHLDRKVACNWVVGPVSRPVDLGKHLNQQGFRCMIHCAAMACDLKRLPSPPANPNQVRIALSTEPPAIHPLSTDRRRRRHEARVAMMLYQPRQVWCFAAKAGSQTVGETMLFAGAGVEGVYDVQVLEKFRRRGIASALVHAALCHAKKLGFHAAVLAATGIGSGVYARRGFREVGKLSFYKYGKMRQLGD